MSYSDSDRDETISEADRELFLLKALSKQFPNETAAVAEIAYLEGLLTLPTGSIHVLSDIHGAATKLQHVIYNASGTLRPVVEELMKNRLSPAEIRDLLMTIYYPRESYAHAVPEGASSQEEEEFFRRTVRLAFDVMREVARSSTTRTIQRILPSKYKELFTELFFDRPSDLGREYIDALLNSLVRNDRSLDFLRHISRAIRNLSIDELVVAGDCGDRGTRIDQVIDIIQRQPNVSVTWGNHDVTWMGACLGSPLLIATVLRISLRYRRLSQLEEGYGIITSPLERLARTVYEDDPAERFQPKGEGIRDTLTMARMQKAIAVIEFKLEGETIARNPDYAMGHRNLIGSLDPLKGTVTVDGITHPLLDSNFPTVDRDNPYALSPEEAECMTRLQQTFLRSKKLWQHMLFLKNKGSMFLTRDDNLIFHGCLAVTEDGEDLPMIIDGESYSGKAMMLKLDEVVHRAFRERRQEDLDLLWYLWAGVNSPLFGKDKMATLERYLVADKATHKEAKNPYFRLIHEASFCEKVLREFDLPESGLIVNGHVPVKIEQGEDPLKRSGKAITIDGAFSDAYGDHGYTLLIGSTGVSLAQHYHFESIADAVTTGTEIIPSVRLIRSNEGERRVRATRGGASVRHRIILLQKLCEAFRLNQVAECR